MKIVDYESPIPSPSHLRVDVADEAVLCGFIAAFVVVGCVITLIGSGRNFSVVVAGGTIVFLGTVWSMLTVFFGLLRALGAIQHRTAFLKHAALFVGRIGFTAALIVGSLLVLKDVR